MEWGEHAAHSTRAWLWGWAEDLAPRENRFREIQPGVLWRASIRNMESLRSCEKDLTYRLSPDSGPIAGVPGTWPGTCLDPHDTRGTAHMKRAADPSSSQEADLRRAKRRGKVAWSLVTKLFPDTASPPALTLDGSCLSASGMLSGRIRPALPLRRAFWEPNPCFLR